MKIFFGYVFFVASIAAGFLGIHFLISGLWPFFGISTLAAAVLMYSCMRLLQFKNVPLKHGSLPKTSFKEQLSQSDNRENLVHLVDDTDLDDKKNGDIDNESESGHTAKTESSTGTQKPNSKNVTTKEKHIFDEAVGSYKSNLPQIGIAISLLALLPFPTDFYLLTRLGICVTAGLLAYQLYKSNPDEQQGWWVLMAACAVFYNPVFPQYLHSRELWMIINILTALLFWQCGKMEKERANKSQKSKWKSPWE